MSNVYRETVEFTLYKINLFIYYYLILIICIKQNTLNVIYNTSSVAQACLTKNYSVVFTLVKQLVVVISFTTHIILSKATVHYLVPHDRKWHEMWSKGIKLCCKKGPIN